MVHGHTLDEPHSGCAAAACTMNESRLTALGRDRIQKLIGDSRVGHLSIERNAVITDTCSFGGGSLGLEIGARLACLPQIDDGRESHLLYIGDGGGLNGSGAC